jgi:TPR repeat protein
MGRRYIEGEGVVTRDPRRAAALLARACEAGAGYAGACVTAGDLHWSGEGAPRDEARAIALYQRACELNECQQVDPAVLWPLCEAGEAIACHDLAGQLKIGAKAPKEAPGATGLFERACEAGHTQACLDLADDLRWGDAEATADPARADTLIARAESLLARACDEGDAEACFSLAVEYQTSLGIPEDGERALALLEKACDGGSLRACGRLHDR